MHFGGIVLCGGRSSRMGLPKATLPFGDELMLQRVVRLLGELVQPIVVVAAADQELPALSGDVIVTRDEREGRGPLEGLRAGLTAITAHCDAAYATSCDVPLLAPGFVQFMLDALSNHQIAVPVEGGFHHPLAAVYRTAVLPHIESLLAADRLRPVFLFDEVDTHVVPVEQLKHDDPELRTLANLNHPQDYLNALAEAGLEVPAELAARLASS